MGGKSSVRAVRTAPRRPRNWAILSVVALLCGLVALFAPAASAQDTTTAPPAGTPLSSGEVKIDLDTFGVGNVARAGDWCGIRLRVMDTGSKNRNLIVRVAGLDYDGDTPLYQREIASNPGLWQGVWIYVRLPFSYSSQAAPLTAAVYEATEAGDVAADEAAFRAGRLLGFTELRLPGGLGGVIREQTQAMIALVGQHKLGLGVYSSTSAGVAMGGGNIRGFNPYGHEITDIVAGLTPASLPDRWMGLLSFDAVVWAQGDPAELRNKGGARALREYVQHGGHLIVVLPSIGQTWTNPASNDLHDIMPLVTVGRREVTDFQRYRPLLAREPLPGTKDLTAFPSVAIVHTFRPLPDAGANEAVRILNNPDGECIAVRRHVGAGSVTLIGLDLNQTALSQGQLVEADVFWHRILGRRGSYIDRSNQPNMGIVPRKPWFVDQDIARDIARQGRAAAGVLVGFIVFVVYWLIAAPVGFLVLRRFKLTHHAWLAFIATSAVFTVISWTGARMLRPSNVEMQHLTIMDHVYGQPLQRARMWASLVIPWYGTAQISVGNDVPPGSAARLTNPVASWDAPAAEAASWGGFPDVRGYIVDTRSPDSIDVPSRSTVKQVEVSWAGGPVWEMPRPARVEEGGTGGIELIEPTGSRATDRRPLLNGTLVHNLPAGLRDGIVIVVRRQRPLTRSGLGAYSVCIADVFPIGFAWEAGIPLDLGIVTRPPAPKSGDPNSAPALTDLNTYINAKFTPNVQMGAVSDNMELFQRFNALALFTQLPPPEQGFEERYAAQRSATHSWDLGLWFTEPCVILLGQMTGTSGTNAPSPVPLMVDGEIAPGGGRTMLRWIYPLPDDPPAFPDAEGQPSAPDPGTPSPGQP